MAGSTASTPYTTELSARLSTLLGAPISRRERIERLALNLRRQRALNDYPFFLRSILGFSHTQFTDPGVQSYLREIGDFILDWHANRHQQLYRRNLMVVVPRECSKTSAITEPLPLWLNLRDPNNAVAIESYDYEKVAVPMVSTARKHFEGNSPGSTFTAIFGDGDPAALSGQSRPGCLWRDDSFTSPLRTAARRDPTCKAFSIRRGATSGHFDTFILDDPITQEIMATEGDNWLTKVWQHYVHIDALIRRDGLFVLIGTRYGEGDLIGRIIEEEIKPKVRKALGLQPNEEIPDWDARFPEYAEAHANWKIIYRRAVDEAADGSPIINFPTIWPAEAIEETRSKGIEGELFYAAQLQNDPASRADNPVQRHHVEAAHIAYDDIPAQAFSRVSLHCDFAFQDESNYSRQRGDYCTAQLWGHHAGHVYLLNSVHDRLTQDLFAEQLIRLVKSFRESSQGRRPFCITYDKPIGQGAGAKMTKSWLLDLFHREGLTCPRIIEISRSGKSKTGRLLAVAGFWQDGRVHFQPTLPGARELSHQMLNIGYTRHDDMADAAADVFHEDVYSPSHIERDDSDDGPFAAMAGSNIVPFSPFAQASGDYHSHSPFRSGASMRRTRR